ncbi:hypothetical protein SETIT_2G187700v2 [Setaria italica]|uniref:Protein NO VEIN C-terminal domain-containing protein n=1 Tax=Setaria italica TaxID=4555 RepID=A0A368Q0A1_SETIT|nr:uncharacterized protein LOC111256316 [Setaria italica]RCV11466.1 hypothetical protein SETIT_2G187700v2 [Setaria italica]
MAPAKTGRRNNRQEKKMTTTTRASRAVGNRRPIGSAFSKFGRVAALHARRKIVKERGSKRGRSGGLATGRNERVRLDARVLDANMLSSRRHGEGVAHKQDGLVTGRLGESAVHKYFVEKLGCSSIKWMNEDNESGLLYDISITKADATEYVEVKATSIPNKNRFHITRRELQFAAEKGDSLTIAYVLLSKPDKASIVFLKNPHKLVRQRDLKPASIVFFKS